MKFQIAINMERLDRFDSCARISADLEAISAAHERERTVMEGAGV